MMSQFSRMYSWALQQLLLLIGLMIRNCASILQTHFLCVSSIVWQLNISKGHREPLASVSFYTLFSGSSVGNRAEACSEMQSNTVPVEILSQVMTEFMTFQEVAVARIVCRACDSGEARRRQFALLAQKQSLFHNRMLQNFRMAAYFESRARLCMGHRDRYMGVRVGLMLNHDHRAYTVAWQLERGTLTYGPIRVVSLRAGVRDPPSGGSERVPSQNWTQSVTW